MREGNRPARHYSTAHQHTYPYAAQVSPQVQPAPQLQIHQVAAEVAHFFQDLRAALHLTPVQAAQALSTRVDIVAAFEAAKIAALPPWPETCRIVRTYASYAGLDPRPVLHSLEQLFHALPRTPAPEQRGGAGFSRIANGGAQGASMLKALTGALNAQVLKPANMLQPFKAVRAGGRAARQVRSAGHAIDRHAGRPGTALFVVTTAVALVALVTQTSVLEAAVAQLPSPMKRIVQGAHNYVIVQFAPVRDGLRWIDVPDPRTRRGDKLQTAERQSD